MNVQLQLTRLLTDIEKQVFTERDKTTIQFIANNVNSLLDNTIYLKNEALNIHSFFLFNHSFFIVSTPKVIHGNKTLKKGIIFQLNTPPLKPTFKTVIYVKENLEFFFHYQQMVNQKVFYENFHDKYVTPQVFFFGPQDKIKIQKPLVTKKLITFVERVGKSINLQRKKIRAFHWQNKLELITKIVDLIKIMHANGFVHRDIKPHNIVTNLTSTYLIDGEFVTQVDKKSGQCGTIRYFDLANAISYDETASMASDIWSLAYTIFEIFTGNFNTNLFRLAQQKIHPFFPNRLNEIEPLTKKYCETIHHFHVNTISFKVEDKKNEPFFAGFTELVKQMFTLDKTNRPTIFEISDRIKQLQSNIK